MQRSPDLTEAAAGLTDVSAAKGAHELVTPVAQNGVEGPKPRPDGLDDRPEHLVASGVPPAIVDALQAVHVDEGHDEAAVGTPCASDLVRQHVVPHLASVGPGQVVEIRRLQFGGGLGTIVRGTAPVESGLGAITRRAGLELAQFPVGWLTRRDDARFRQLRSRVP